ncbi:MAG TPA: DUF1918 domain-containing protein [Actinomycetota bacterium]|jgi:hypothetical protein|nr:DUF1918 domain-containing protein [Actinomycetota bacterium]
MSAKAGDRLEIESETVGTPAREGEIVEVIQGAISVRYRIRWGDGHESVITPSGGTARIIPRRAPKKGRAKTK